MALNIPVPSSPFASQTVLLGNTVITMTFKFNTVNNSWYIDLFDSEGVKIKTGIKVIGNQDLTTRYSLENLPDGRLMCLNNKKTPNPVGRNNFGVGEEYELIWVSESELNT